MKTVYSGLKVFYIILNAKYPLGGFELFSMKIFLLNGYVVVSYLKAKNYICSSSS